ncbi:MAG: sulfite exporter TauE/SafE family protein [Burkholderiaceae bacterium]
MSSALFPAISDPLFYAAAIPAVVLTGISKAGTGGGVGSLAVPLLTLAVAGPQAAAIMLPILIVLDAFGLVAFRKRFDARLLRLTLPAALIGILVGTLLFHVVDQRLIKALIGAEAVIFALAKLREGAAAWTAPPAALSPLRARFWSAIAGFTSFISHAGGPPMMQLMLPLRLAPALFVGTLTWFFAVVNFVKLAPYAWLGLIDTTNLATSLMLLPVAPIGYLLGLRLLRWMKPSVFVRVVTWAMLLTGCKLLYDGLA